MLQCPLIWFYGVSEIVVTWRSTWKAATNAFVRHTPDCATLAFFCLYCFYCPSLRLPGICQTPLMFFYPLLWCHLCVSVVQIYIRSLHRNWISKSRTPSIWFGANRQFSSRKQKYWTQQWHNNINQNQSQEKGEQKKNPTQSQGCPVGSDEWWSVWRRSPSLRSKSNKKV